MATRTRSILTWANAASFLKGKQSRTLAHATSIRQTETGGLAIRYHDTDVVTLHPDNTYTLRTGGWYTPTTKSRINQYAPAVLSQLNGLWWIRGATDEHGSWIHPYLFIEGIRVDRTGKPLQPIDPAPIEAAKKQLDREVSKYIKGFITKTVQARGIDRPSGGDCWGCVEGDPMGLDHYREHFREEYFVPRLLLNALVECGYRNPGVIWNGLESELAQGRTPWGMRNALTRFFGRRKLALLGLTDAVQVTAGKGWQG